MNLQEFQAKTILKGYGIAVPRGHVADTAEEVERAARDLGGRVAVKAQVSAGARGKASGVRLLDVPADARRAAESLLGKPLVTEQTGPSGQTVRRILVESAADAKEELYAAAHVDAASGRIAILVSRHGGTEIEDNAAGRQDRIKTLHVDPDKDPDQAAMAELAAEVGLGPTETDELARILAILPRVIVDNDASLVEINPLALTVDGAFVALDAKIVIDDNALFRHADLRALRSEEDVDPVEAAAQGQEINYVGMDGDIGIVVNGAGLALATLDMVHDAGGKPANFMDIRTTALSMNIAKGVDLLLANDRVKVLLVNIHGGGMQRCDTVVEGIGVAMRRSQRKLPIVMRAAGNNAEFARQRLKNFKIDFTDSDDMADAVAKAVAIAGGGQA